MIIEGLKFDFFVNSRTKRIYVKKSREKKFLEKKSGNKNFGKKSEFSQVLGKNVTGFLGLFFLK